MNDRERIEYIMNLYMLTPSQFADKTGIQRASVSHILGNRNKPSLEIMLKIYHAFPAVALEWLVAGEGNPPTLDEPLSAVDEDSILPESTVNTQQTLAPTLFPMDEIVSQERAVELPAAGVNVAEPANASAEKKVESEISITNASVTDAVVSAAAGKDSSQISLRAEGDRRIKEIKVFYDNGTYETFLPEKP